MDKLSQQMNENATGNVLLKHSDGEIGVKSHPDEAEGDKSKVKMRRTMMLRWKDKQEAEYQRNSGDDAEGDEKKAKETRSVKRRRVHLSFCFSQLHAYSFHTTYWGFIKETE